MALDKLGVVFRSRKTGGKVCASGKLFITPKMLERWMEYEEVEDRGKKGITVEIGLFNNSKDGKEWINVCEFIKDGNGETQGINSGLEPSDGEKSELPF